MTSNPDNPTVCLLSLTPIAREARLIRQATSLKKAGWNVFACGFGCDQPMLEGVDLIEVLQTQPELGLLEEWCLRLKHKSASWNDGFATDYYWNFLGNEPIFQQIAFIEGRRADLVVGHEFFSAPLAARLADYWKVPFALDIHEYAVEQYAHDPIWRKTEPRYIRAIERSFLRRAAVVTTICDGIADALHCSYALKERPIVNRSASLYAEMPFNPSDATIDVLYHGLVSPLRGLETAIQSVKLWRPEFRFVIRGLSSDEYVASLKDIAETHGVSDRVDILPGVLLSEMVRSANSADIGFFVQEDVSLHKHYTLPNKIFEYIMAGLAVCVSDLPEMAKVVNTHRIGRLVEELTPESIAAAINSFTRAEIDELKRRSLEAAKVLCWEVEFQPAMVAYREAIDATHSSQGASV